MCRHKWRVSLAAQPQGGRMSQRMFKAKITPSVGGTPVEVMVPANDPFQARKMVESMYGPVKAWWQLPTEVR